MPKITKSLGGSPNPGKIKGSPLANLSKTQRKDVDAWNKGVAATDRAIAMKKAAKRPK